MSTSIVMTADKMLRVMDIMRRNPNSMRPIPSTTKRNTDPVRMVAYGEVVKAKIPLVYTVEINGQEHRLHLIDGYADSESPGRSIVSPYNVVLKALGNKAVLDDNAPFTQVCRAHTAIYTRVVQNDLPMPEGTKLVSAKAQPSKADVKQQPHPAAKAAPTPKEAKPVVTTEKVRPYVWVKNGIEEHITAKQWEQRVRMCGGLDRVPLGCGEIGDRFEMQVLTDDEAETIDIEWVDDIPVVVDIDPATPEFVTVIQRPLPEAKAKRSKAARNAERAQRKAAAEAEVKPTMDLASALAILSR